MMVWRRKLWLWVVIGVMAWGHPGKAETRRYLETTGEAAAERVWQLAERDDRFLATSTFEGSRYVNEVQRDGDTVRWEAHTEEADLVAVRDGKTLSISGQREGKPVRETRTIPDLPWFQSITFSLERFLATDEETVKFVTLLPDELKFIKMRAVRRKVETITFREHEVRARRVVLRLAGWRSALWSAEYWFRAEDGLFLRYEGVNGPPGTPTTVVENLTVPSLAEEPESP